MAAAARDFRQRLAEGAHWEAYVASAFTKEGFHVRLSPSKVGWEYKGAIDLQISLDGTVWAPVEVKGTAPRISQELVLVCSEESFRKHIPNWMLNVQHFLYSNWAFCDPKTGDIYCIPQGVPVVTGHQEWDKKRNQIYSVIKTDAWRLLSLYEFTSKIKEALGPGQNCGPLFWENKPGTTGSGSGRRSGRQKRTGATKSKCGTPEMGAKVSGNARKPYTGLQTDATGRLIRVPVGADDQA